MSFSKKNASVIYGHFYYTAITVYLNSEYSVCYRIDEVTDRWQLGKLLEERIDKGDIFFYDKEELDYGTEELSSIGISNLVVDRGWAKRIADIGSTYNLFIISPRHTNFLFNSAECELLERVKEINNTYVQTIANEFLSFGNVAGDRVAIIARKEERSNRW